MAQVEPIVVLHRRELKSKVYITCKAKIIEKLTRWFVYLLVVFATAHAVTQSMNKLWSARDVSVGTLKLSLERSIHAREQETANRYM